MERLKILWLNWRCWLNPAMGGAEVFTHEVAKRWVATGHEVTLFTSEFPNCKHEEILDGVRVIRSGGKYSVYRNVKKYYKKYFSKENFDVVIDEVNTRPFFTPKFVNNGERIIALIHQLAREYWFYETPFPINFIGNHFLENRWLRYYRDVRTVTVSESTRKDLIDMGFKQISVISEGLNFKPLDHIPAKESFPVVVYVGRLRKAKRPDHAIRAFRIVRDRFPKSELWVIGDGSYKNDLQKMAGNGVRFFTRLSNDKRRNLIAKAWVLVNPSVREGFGLNVIEANALGVPCVAYNVGGLKDAVVNGETGFLVEDGNVDLLGKKICQILADDVLRFKLSQNALLHSRLFSWDKVAAKFMKVINTVIGA
jgi:glycosyltransferase involved in cell wall biosynthesis